VTAPAIATDRLRLRRWTDADRAPFAAMGGDREVMRYLGPLQTRAEADAAIDRANAHLDEHGFTFWAIERLADGAFLGFCGLKRVTIPGPLRGEVEIGWRLQRDAWGHGYAFEAARASRDFGFLYAGLPRICAFTVAANARSWRLMERIGMTRLDDLGFDHPALTEGDPLRPHILYGMGPP
jgi:RimJ/RimL family protein N-acetyltransferase